MKKAIYLLLLGLVVLSVTACTEKVQEGGPSQLETYFTSLDELTSRANDIVEVDILDQQETVEYGGVVFTISAAKVISAQKGNLTPDAVIKVLETGGVMSDGQEFKFNGIPVAKKKDKLFLFLEAYKGPITQDAYVPIGVYQGKFKVEKDEVIQLAPSEEKLKDYKPVKKEEFKTKIKEKIINKDAAAK
ncbi:hypothetical protein ACFFSY_19480 [Paenibacillus aurantiacus]|uniref:Lipoprotein n=1 Tax=Paenibacillus aurantiacus TaxID=1936118 RepID=A0ABV5KSC0_9BACL